MTANNPTVFRWDGEAMVPRHPRIADKLFVIGADYTLEERQERSSATHRHFFAVVNDAWKTLPEHLAEAFPSADHLRKRLLIDAGYYTEQVIDAGTNAAALRVAAFARSKDEFAHVVVRGPLVVERVAKSQNTRAMDRVEFQASKTAVLDQLEHLLGVEHGTLARQAA